MDRKQRLRALHKLNVEYADCLVGRLTGAVDELGLAERTLIIFTCDNGTHRRITSLLGDRSIVFFDHVGSGLVARGGPLTHFTISGNGRRGLPAKAEIDGDTVVVSSPKVKDPASVRFACGDADRPNLFNKEGLPASSFTTGKLRKATSSKEKDGLREG